MTDTNEPDAPQPDYNEMFAALCREVGYCLHVKGEKRVIAALPQGLDAAVKAVLEAEGADFLNTSGSLKRQIRDCLKANRPSGTATVE